MAPRKPLLRPTETDLDAWLSSACDAVWQAPEDAAAVVVTDELDDEFPVGTVLAYGVPLSEGLDATTKTLNELLIDTGPRSMAGLATRINYTPDGGESTPAWVLVLVARRLPAAVVVRREVEDERWWRIPPIDMPWFAAATAGSLREALVERKPMQVKEAPTDDRRLLNKVRTTFTNPALRPPKDEQGHI